VTATAGLDCIRIVDHEPFAHDRLYVVNLRSIKVLSALFIDQNLHAMSFDYVIAVVFPLLL
jgi:hypothetical protein